MLSRDQLNYIDGVSLYRYCRNSVINSTDPVGLLSITPSHPEEEQLGPYECQSQLDVSLGNAKRQVALIKWKFELDNPAPSGGGFMVQSVTIQCAQGRCEGCDLTANTATITYYEAWYVEGGETVEKIGDPFTTDYGQAYVSTRDCGIHSTHGVVKFFSVLEALEALIYWESDQRHFALSGSGDKCGASAGTLPSTREKPIWWDHNPIEGPEFIDFGYTWRCCSCTPEKVEAYARPRSKKS